MSRDNKARKIKQICVFFKRVVLSGEEYPFAMGNNEMEAKENAAKIALVDLWTCGLTNINEKASKRPEPQNANRLVFCQGKYPIGTGKRQQEAREEAAMFVYCDPSDSDYTEFPKRNNTARKSRRQLDFHFAEACQIGDKDKMTPSGTEPTEMTADQSKTITRFCSDFDSIVFIDKGAFGEVYKAKCNLTGMDFAIKIVSTKKTTKDLEEVKALCKLSHPNIVGYRTCWLDESGYQCNDDGDGTSSSASSAESLSAQYLYIQMELCDSKTLRVWLDERNERLANEFVLDSGKDKEEALKIAMDLVNGVKHIHSKRLIHRDLKPANIMFGQDGNDVKIGDFGLVTAMIEKDDRDAESRMERTVYKGTPSYMAPEQKSERYYDHKVDIFALGLIYFELFWNISTGHERQGIWDDLRRRKFPQRFINNFREYTIIRPMLCERPDGRPEASQIKTTLKEPVTIPHGSRSV